jgi:small-conductance mechanosensitive channel
MKSSADIRRQKESFNRSQAINRLIDQNTLLASEGRLYKICTFVSTLVLVFSIVKVSVSG